MRKRERLKIAVEPGFILVETAVMFFLGVGFAVTAIAAALWHEAGHLAALRLCGVKPRRLRCQAWGMLLEYDGRLSYGEEIVCALSGPTASFVGAIISGALFGTLGWDWLALFSGISTIYGIFNLIPAGVADGGRAILAAIAWSRGQAAAERARFALDIACFLILLTVGVYVFTKSGGNLTIILCAILLANVCCKKAGYGVKF